MTVLYDWRGSDHRRDLDLRAGHYLNQSSPLLHEVVIGASVRAFAWPPGGRYVLAVAGRPTTFAALAREAGASCNTVP